VSVAPDTVQAEPSDSSVATVVVRLAEAPVHQIDAGLGWGSVECFRGDARWESRSFGGGARRLVLSGAASKLGISTGLSSICRAYSTFASDTFADALDYRLSADLTQPFFISPRNNLALNLFAERISEPNVFQRQAAGGRLSFTRRLTRRTFLTSSVDVEHGRTVATDALFCGAFQVCDTETIARLGAARFRNSLNVNVLRERRDQPLDPTTGYVLRSGLTWAPSWLASDVTFVRWTGDFSVYRELSPRWISAASIRFGNFFQTALPGSLRDFLPPEDRLFAGGATTVRGFGRNLLGPGIWVTDQVERDPETNEALTDPETGAKVPVRDAAQFIPSGGTAMLVLNAELRAPSPFLTDVLRLAFFVDAGSVATRQLWDLTANELKITPGAGIRFQTPVGPVRMDAAYNPHGDRTAPLYLSDPETGALVRIEDAFRPEPGGLLSRLRIHLSVGQAF
jgi:outer membrane protein assembly factor BamA